MAFWLSSYCLLSLQLVAKTNLGKKEEYDDEGSGYDFPAVHFGFLVLIFSRGGCLQYRRDTMLTNSLNTFLKPGNSFSYVLRIMCCWKGGGGRNMQLSERKRAGEWVSYLKCHFSKVILSWSTENDDGFELTSLPSLMRRPQTFWQILSTLSLIR